MLGRVTAGLGLLLGAAVITTAAPAGAAPVGLSVSVSDGAEETEAGATLTYTATVRNTGGEAISGRLVISLPSYLTHGAQAPKATVAGSDATWSITVTPGGESTVTATATVGAPPLGERSVVVLASVILDGADSPVIRSADSDRLAGAGAPTSVTLANSDSTDREGGLGPVGYALASLGLVAVLAIAVLLLVRRSRRAPS